jgi:hypothetical protein
MHTGLGRSIDRECRQTLVCCAVASLAYAAPFAFNGGSIRNVIIEVSGEPYIDVELEALGGCWTNEVKTRPFRRLAW